MNKKKNKAVVFAVVNGIEERVVKRFLEINQHYAPKYIDIKVHTSVPTEGPFNLALAMNNAIKEYSPHYDVIMKTDVDMIMSPGHMIEAYECARVIGSAYRSWIRYCTEDHPYLADMKNIPWPKVAELEPYRANGAFFAMSVKTWGDSGGFPECCLGWGGEDCAFVDKLNNKMSIRKTVAKLHPIVHIEHEQREWKTTLSTMNGKNNFKRALLYKNRNWFKRPLTRKEKDAILG